MIGVILLVIGIFGTTLLEAARSPGFKVKYNATGIRGTTSYISLPQNVTAAESTGWIQVSRPEGPEEYSSLVMWCPTNDYTVCVLFDDTEYAAGIQIGMDQKTTNNMAFDMRTQGFVNWTTIVNGDARNYWALQQFFFSSDFLTQDALTRTSSRNSSKFIQGSEVYAVGFYGNVYSVPTVDIKNSNFTEQNCVPGMGIHYYYNVTSTLECEATTIFPWFLLVDDGEVIGVSFLAFAEIDSTGTDFNWLEYYGVEIFMMILKSAPDCLYELGRYPGLVVLHIFFIENPYDITC